MTIAAAVLAQLVHVLLMLIAPPALAGATGWLDARLTGRAGPPLTLPWRELRRLSRKTMVAPEGASPVLAWAPSAGLAATCAAAALVPSFTLGMALSPLADGLAIAGLLCLARAARCLAALDAGSAGPGLAAQDSSALAVLSEPALMLLLFGLALMAGGFNLETIIGQQQQALLLPEAASALMLACLLALLLCDEAAWQLDADLSGINLAVSRFTVWLRRVIWIDLIGALFLPAGMASMQGGVLDWGIGLLAWVVKLAAAALCLSGIRQVMGRLGWRERPKLLGLAALLALLAMVVAMASLGSA
jgi:formate hydrogenlyase subunit 4